MDPIKVGQLIADSRKNLNMTQKELAEQLSITGKAVSKWERGLSLPDISLLLPLSQILGVNLYELLKGEKISQEDLDEILKHTIIHSANEMKKQKTKYLKYCVTMVIAMIVLCFLLLVSLYRNKEAVGAITDRDALYHISYYLDDFSDNEQSLDVLDEKLPLTWGRKSITLKENSLTLNYSSSFTETIKAYNDKHYVKLAMIHMSTVLFTLIEDIDTIHIAFEDCKYTILRNDVQNVFALDDDNAIIDEESWEHVISEKLSDKEFVSTAFQSLFFKTN